MRKKFSLEKMREYWDLYKLKCDTKCKRELIWSPKTLETRVVQTPAPVPYDVKGFMAYIGLSEQAFYRNYAGDPKYASFIDLMKLECENAKREAFEQGTIPANLAGLWMSRYDGYTTKTTIEGDIPVVIDGGDSLGDE